MRDDIILVDANDNEIGTSTKEWVHKEGLLHRAFSVIIYNEKGEILLQRRALHKYHTPGLWSNTCCSHPFPGETVKSAAERRLKEEMGLSMNLEFAFSTTYKFAFPNGTIEHEFDHVFLGTTDTAPIPNPDEVCDWKYITIENLHDELLSNPENYTAWFKQILNKLTFH